VTSGAATADLLWGRRTDPRRGPRPSLDLATIAAAGVAIADDGGLAAVTMQRVAERLGVTKMALYRYVPGRAQMVALMTDLGMGTPPRLDEVAGGWRPRLEHWSTQIFTLFSDHPWALEATLGPRVMGPNELGWLEEALAVLSETQLTGDQKLDLVATLLGHVRMLAQQAAAMGGAATEESLSRTMRVVLAGEAERFPSFVEALADPGTEGHALEFGLRCILDGVASVADRRS